MVITRNPFGFTNKVKRQKGKVIYAGVGKGDSVDDNKFVRFITSALKRHNISVSPQQIQIENHKALPDLLETFQDMFIDKTTGEIKQENLFKRRILGLTSYFRSASEALLPKYNDSPQYYHIEKIPMSPHQIGIYEKARAAERKEEDRNARKKAKQKEGVYAETTSTYRIFSRAFCNFVFPNEIIQKADGSDMLLTRPMPKTGETLEQTISTKLITKERKEDKTKERIDEDIMDAIEIQDKLENQDGLYTNDDVTDIERQVREQTDVSYKDRIDESLDLLVENGSRFLSPTALTSYSPKFKRVLENIKNTPSSTGNSEGLHLIYSQFRTIEGVGVFKLVLKHNGFAEFKIKKNTWLIISI